MYGGDQWWHSIVSAGLFPLLINTHPLSVHGGVLHALTPISAVGCHSTPACFTWHTRVTFESIPPGREPGVPTRDPLPVWSALEFLRTCPFQKGSSRDPGVTTVVDGLCGSLNWGLLTAHQLDRTVPVHRELSRAANGTGIRSSACNIIFAIFVAAKQYDTDDSGDYLSPAVKQERYSAVFSHGHLSFRLFRTSSNKNGS